MMQLIFKILFSKKKKWIEALAKLESTKKCLRMLNSGTTDLKQILTMGKASSDYHGLRYQNRVK